MLSLIQRGSTTRAALLAALVVALTMFSLHSDGLAPASASHEAAHVDANGNPLPHAQYRIWDLNYQDPAADPPDPLFGNDPNMTVSDPTGASLHVATAASPFTNITVMENTFCSGLPCGVTYWNPATNIFKCYGYSSGSMTGIDVNVSAPLIVPPAGVPLPPAGSYGTGDVWLAKSGSFSTIPGGFDRPLTVQFPGTDLFRSWDAGNLSSLSVDQSTGLIWFTDQNGFLGVFDPGTNGVKRWFVGGIPRDIVTVPGTGLAYATVGPDFAGGGDDIVEVDRITNVVRRWAIPAVGHLPPSLQGFFDAFTENPNGISIDSAGLVWFAETISNEVASLDPATNTFTEYLKVDPDTGVNAIIEPQNVASSGFGATQQTFFTEGAGNATGIVTPAEAAGTTQEIITVVLPTVPAIDPEEATLQHEDHEHEPSQKDIPPTIHDSPGVDGVPWTDPGPTTAAGEVIPGIIRFPFPPAFQRAVGMTEVLLPNTVFGSLIGPATSPFPSEDEHVFEMTSAAIIAEPEPQGSGRMTGGGRVEGTRVTHGFQLHCDASVLPNNLQINWDRGNKFHLESLTSAVCLDDPAIEPPPPPANFDTYVGTGEGRYNGVSGATVEFTFSDAGEPGRNDVATILVKDADGATVLDVTGTLLRGNHQAHEDEAPEGVGPVGAFVDTDGDGCTDLQEWGYDETAGGQRDPDNPWDFYDTNGDGVIDVPNDILGVILAFSGYDVIYDRGPSAGPDPWNMTAPDGVIDLPNDILGVIFQFGHTCSPVSSVASFDSTTDTGWVFTGWGFEPAPQTSNLMVVRAGAGQGRSATVETASVSGMHPGDTIGANSAWVFTGSGYEPRFPDTNNSDEHTKLCYD